MTESKDSFDGAAPEPSAPPLDHQPDENLPVATPVDADPPAGPPAGGGGSSTTAPTSAPSTTETNIDPEESRQKGAGIAAAVIGFFLGGPFLSLIFGGGTYYVATKRPEGDAAGDAARSLGDVALTVRDRAKELDQKHDIVNKTKSAAGSLWQKSKERGEELNAKHDIVGKGRNFVERVYLKAVELNREHHIVERTVALVGMVWTTVTNKLFENGEQHNTSDTSTGTDGASTSSAPNAN